MARGILYTFVADGNGGYKYSGMRHLTFDGVEEEVASAKASEAMKEAVSKAQLTRIQNTAGERVEEIIEFTDAGESTYRIMNSVNGYIESGIKIEGLKFAQVAPEMTPRTPSVLTRPKHYDSDQFSNLAPSSIWQSYSLQAISKREEFSGEKVVYYTATKFGNRKFTRKTDGGGVSYYEAQDVGKGIINIADEKGNEYQPRTLPPSPLIQKTGREVVVAIASAGDNGDKLPLLSAVQDGAVPMRPKRSANSKMRTPSYRQSFNAAVVRNPGDAQSLVEQSPHGKAKEREAANAAELRFRVAREVLEARTLEQQEERRSMAIKAYSSTTLPPVTPSGVRSNFDLNLWPVTSTPLPLRAGSLAAHNKRFLPDQEAMISRFADNFDQLSLPPITPVQARSAEEIRSDYEDAQAIFDESNVATRFREKELLEIQGITERGRLMGESLQDSLQAFYTAAVPRWKADIVPIREVEGDSDAVVAKKNSVTQILYILLEHARIEQLNLQLQQNLVDLEGLNRDLADRLAVKEDELTQASHVAQNQSRRAKAAGALLDQSQLEVDDDLEAKDSEIQGLKDKIKVLNGKIFNLKRDLEDKKALDDRMLEALAGYDEQQQQLRAGQKQIESLTGENTALLAENEALEKEKERLIALNHDLIAQLELLQQDLKAAVEAKEAAEAATLAAQKALREAQLELAKEKQALVDAQQELDHRPQVKSRPASTLVDGEGMDLAAELAAVSVEGGAPVDASAALVAELKQKIATLEDEVAQLKADALAKEAEVVRTAEAHTNLALAQTELSKQFQVATKSNEEAKAREAAYQQGLADLEAQVVLLEAEAGRTKDRVTVVSGAAAVVNVASQSPQTAKIESRDVVVRFYALKNRLVKVQENLKGKIERRDIKIKDLQAKRDAALEAKTEVEAQLAVALAANKTSVTKGGDADTKIADLEAKNDELTQKVAAFEKQIVGLRAENAAQAQQTRQYFENISQIDKKRYDAELKNVTDENARLSGELAGLQTKIAELTAAAEKKEASYASGLEKVSEVNVAEIKGVKDKFGALQTRFDTVKGAFEAKLVKKDAEIARVAGERDAAREAQQAVVQQLAAAQAAKRVVDEDLVAAQAAVAASGLTDGQLQQTNASQAAEIQRLKDEVTRLTGLQTANNTEIASLKAENTRLSAQVTTLGAEIDQLKQEKAERVRTIQALEAKALRQARELEKEKADRAAEKDVLEARLAAATATAAATLEQQKAASDQVIAANELAIAAKKQEVAAAQEALALAKSEHAAALVAAGGDNDGAKAKLRMQIQELITSVAEKDVEIARLKQELVDEKAKNADLTKKLDALKLEKEEWLKRGLLLEQQLEASFTKNKALLATNTVLVANNTDLQNQLTQLNASLEAKAKEGKDKDNQLAAQVSLLEKEQKKVAEIEAQLLNNKKDTDAATGGLANLVQALTAALNSNATVVGQAAAGLVDGAIAVPRLVDGRDAIIAQLKMDLQALLAAAKEKTPSVTSSVGLDAAALPQTTDKKKKEGFFRFLRGDKSKKDNKAASGATAAVAAVSDGGVSEHSAEANQGLQNKIAALLAQIAQLEALQKAGPVMAPAVDVLVQELKARLDNAAALTDNEARLRQNLGDSQTGLEALQARYDTENAAWVLEKAQMQAEILTLQQQVTAAQQEAEQAKAASVEDKDARLAAEKALVVLQDKLAAELAKGVVLERRVTELQAAAQPPANNGAAVVDPTIALNVKIAELEAQLEALRAANPAAVVAGGAADEASGDYILITSDLEDATKIEQLSAELERLQKELATKNALVAGLAEAQAALVASQKRVGELEKELNQATGRAAATSASLPAVVTNEDQELSAQAKTYEARLQNLNVRLKMLVGEGVDGDGYPKTIQYGDGKVVYVANQDGGFVGIFTANNDGSIVLAISNEADVNGRPNFAQPNAGEREAQFLNLDTKVAELQAKQLTQKNEKLRAKEVAVEAALAAVEKREAMVTARETALAEAAALKGKGKPKKDSEEEVVVHGSDGASKPKKKQSTKTPAPKTSATKKKSGVTWGELEYITTMWATPSTTQNLYTKSEQDDDGNNKVKVSFDVIDQIAELISNNSCTMSEPDKKGAQKCISDLKLLLGEEGNDYDHKQGEGKFKKIAGLIYKGTYKGSAILKEEGHSLLYYVNKYNDLAKSEKVTKEVPGSSPSLSIKVTALAGGRVPVATK